MKTLFLTGRAVAELRGEARGGGFSWEIRERPDGRFELDVDDDVHAELRDKAAKWHCSVSEVIIRLVRHAVKIGR